MQRANSRPPKVFVDARSASGRRITGWERYARSVVEALVGLPWISIFAVDVEQAAFRLVSDLSLTRLQSRGADIRHHLTYAPTQVSPNTIITVHDLVAWKHPEHATTYGNRIYRPLVERAIGTAQICTVSRTMADEISEYFGIEKPRVVYPTVDTSRFDYGETLEVRKPYILTIGSVEPRKNLAGLVDAFKDSSINQDFDLVVAGRLAWGELPRQIRHIDSPSDSQLSKLIAGATALVSASQYEGFGIPLVEAQAAGTPVLCSDIPVFREVTGGYASYFDPRSKRDILRALSTIPGLAAPEAAKLNAGKYSVAAMRTSLVTMYIDVNQEQKA